MLGSVRFFDACVDERVSQKPKLQRFTYSDWSCFSKTDMQCGVRKLIP